MPGLESIFKILELGFGCGEYNRHKSRKVLGLARAHKDIWSLD